MAPPTAAKKKKQESIAKNRVTNGSQRDASSVPPESEPCSTAAAPKIKPVKIHRPLNSSKGLSETQLNHLKNLNTSNAIRRKADAATARAISAEMKLNRQKRNHSVLGATSAEDSDSSFSETKEETEEVAALKFSNLISTDIPAEPTKTSTTSLQISTIPAFPTHTHLISRQIPEIHSQTPASLKSPEDVSKRTFYKRLKANRERAKNELGAGYRVTNSPEGKVSVEEAARFKVLKRLTDDQYAGLDSKHYPGLTSVKKYLKDLSKKLEDLEKDGLAQAIINHINSLEAFPRTLIRICIGIDKGSDTVKIVWFLVDLTDPLSPKKLKIFACILGDEKRECLMPYLDLIDEAVAFLQNGLIETKHGFKEFLCFFVGDCKIKDEVGGLQGGSATCPCVYCVVPSSEWGNTESIDEWMLRSIDELLIAGEEVEEAEASGTLKAAQLSNLKKQKKSVKARPMMKNILIKRFCPPIVHIGISAVSSTVKYCKEKCTMPNCRRILKHLIDHPEIDGLGTDLLRSFARVEFFFVARDLTDEEIEQLDVAIQNFFALIDEKYPDFLGKKTKLHILRHHVMPFVIEFGSIGKFSEQSLESIHRIKNLCDTRIPGKSEAAKQRKIQYFTSQQRLINHFTTEGSA